MILKTFKEFCSVRRLRGLDAEDVAWPSAELQSEDSSAGAKHSAAGCHRQHHPTLCAGGGGAHHGRVPQALGQRGALRKHSL